MKCSGCDKEMFIILADRAFCEHCYRELQKRQAECIEEMPKARTK